MLRRKIKLFNTIKAYILPQFYSTEEGTVIPVGMPIGGSGSDDIGRRQDSCVSNSGYTYAHRDTWKVSPCQSCVCTNGQIHCFAQTCPILECERTTLVKGHCCPVCLGE